jgi:hypothetical protein
MQANEFKTSRRPHQTIVDLGRGKKKGLGKRKKKGGSHSEEELDGSLPPELPPPEQSVKIDQFSF